MFFHSGAYTKIYMHMGLPARPQNRKGKLTLEANSVQLLSHVQLFVTPRTAAHQASLSITNSWGLLKLMAIKLMMASNHLTLCHPFLLLPSVFPSIRI